MMNTNKISYQGYVSARPFGKFNIPVPLQSSALRNYCISKGIKFILPVNEPIYEGSYIVLEGLLSNLNSCDGIIMASTEMLPKNQEYRINIFKKIIDHKKLLVSVIENSEIKNWSDVEMFEQSLEISNFAIESFSVVETYFNEFKKI